MKNAGAKVYMEFINYKGDVTSRTLIAEFVDENWADSFMRNEKGYVSMWNDVRLVKEVTNVRLVKEVANA